MALLRALKLQTSTLQASMARKCLGIMAVLVWTRQTVRFAGLGGRWAGPGQPAALWAAPVRAAVQPPVNPPVGPPPRGAAADSRLQAGVHRGSRVRAPGALVQAAEPAAGARGLLQHRLLDEFSRGADAHLCKCTLPPGELNPCLPKLLSRRYRKLFRVSPAWGGPKQESLLPLEGSWTA